jgi:hypothetical protein
MPIPAQSMGMDSMSPRLAGLGRTSRGQSVLALFCVALVSGAAEAVARDAGDPIRLVWTEGDVAGMTRILSPNGAGQIGFIEYHQRRHGNVLETVRVARFADGSSDEDQAQAYADTTLEALRGRSIIRDIDGNPIVDITIDVERGRIAGFFGAGDKRRTYDEHVALPAGTYWGPLIFIVVKNFDENATGDRLVFHTVAPTPRPRTIDMELVRDGSTAVERPGGRLNVARFVLRPTINWLVDPVIQRIAPRTRFFVHPGRPPALARFEGPRNYTGQKILLE